MKKSFMFATMSAAVLFAGCSSNDDLAANLSGQEDLDGDQVAIQIGVASKASMAMRGTGTVGDIEGQETNIWNGEQINVLMYEIDSETGLPTFNPVLGADKKALYDGSTTLYTPLTGEDTDSGIAKEATEGSDPLIDPSNAKYKVKYYPQTGRSDFWGYYLGGVGAESALAESAKIEGDLTQGYQTLGFVIDGTHDLMVAKAPTTKSVGTFEAEELTSNQSTEIAQDATLKARAMNNSYSATAARQGLQPDLVFKHLLSRLQFKVKAGNEKAANCNVTVTGIKIRSKKTGDLIVAYDYTTKTYTDAERIIWANVEAEEDFTDDIVTGTDVTGKNEYYPALELKQRKSEDDRTMVELEKVALTWNANGEGEDVKSIGEALLVAPQDSYYIEVAYSIAAGTEADWYKNYDSDLAPGDVVPSGDLVEQTPLVSKVVRTQKTDGNTPDDFQPGESYLITITLYGPEEIKITATLTGWVQSDDDIVVDPDADED